VESSEFPEHIIPQVGKQLQISQASGPPLVTLITQITDDGITLDANHVLAGKDLFLKLTWWKSVNRAPEPHAGLSLFCFGISWNQTSGGVKGWNLRLIEIVS